MLCGDESRMLSCSGFNEENEYSFLEHAHKTQAPFSSITDNYTVVSNYTAALWSIDGDNSIIIKTINTRLFSPHSIKFFVCNI